MDKFVKFTRKNYLQNKDNKFVPEKANIMPYFEGHNASSFFTLYYEPDILIESKKGTTVTDKRLISVITARPLHVSFKNGTPSFDTYYVDYLCVDKLKRKSGVAPQMIQTHHYNQRHMNRNIHVSLFKREGELTGIVPICLYKTYAFSMARWSSPPVFAATISLIECGKTNIHHLVDFLNQPAISKKKFDIMIIPEISSILELIKTNNIYIYLLIIDDNIEAAYFFKKSCTHIKIDQEALILFASVNSLEKKLDDIFVHGYKVALYKICERFSNYKYAVIEDIADNHLILNDLLIRSKPDFINPTAYFFYNYIFHTTPSSRAFIVC